ncbi:MAG: hypothetical protein HY314_14740 [Acidobacteria bacterium]|nr:hypothetical protein [Acidobacteriota bacterium]
MRVDENHKPAVYLQLAHAAELTELNYWLQLLRVSTREFFGQADRDRFEREASTALGIPVELELTQNLASMGEGDAITRLLASRAPAPAAQPILARYPSLAVRLTGYALRKELGRNKKLAEERAMAIQSQFTDRWKIDRRRIIVSTGGDFRRVVTLALIREPSGP